MLTFPFPGTGVQIVESEAWAVFRGLKNLRTELTCPLKSLPLEESSLPPLLTQAPSSVSINIIAKNFVLFIKSLFEKDT
jgi:hypothetical protein